MTDLAARIIEAARAAWANDYIDAVESDRDVAAYIRQALSIASGPIDADATRRYGAMFNQDAGFILTNGIKYLLADGGVSVEDRAMMEAMKRLDDAWLAACNSVQP
jgi:hypothetical protein